MDAVSPILIERAQEPQGLRNMFVVSLVIHAIAAAAIVISPRPSLEAPPTTVMTISLSAGQVNSGGMTSMVSPLFLIHSTLASRPWLSFSLKDVPSSPEILVM